jgi:CRP-like cAMP-binding protein
VAPLEGVLSKDYMLPPRPSADTLHNHILARLHGSDYKTLRPHLEEVALPLSCILYEAREPIDYVYFPERAVLSAISIMVNGSAIEVATVGNEGLVGYSASPMAKQSANRVIVQVANGGYRIKLDILKKSVFQSTRLASLLSNYEAAFIAQISQSVACNGLHNLEQRCCRWLLMTRDRVGKDDMQLTHEFLGIMLGARRASVTDALRPLQNDGLVHSNRGLISLLDTKRLEKRACECYQVVRDEYKRLLGT